VIFINETGVIGSILAAGTQNLTGSIMATLFFVLIFLVVICIMFNIPLEFAALLLLPFCLGVGAFYSSFIIPITIILIFVSALVAKNWLFR